MTNSREELEIRQAEESLRRAQEKLDKGLVYSKEEQEADEFDYTIQDEFAELMWFVFAAVVVCIVVGLVVKS